MSKYRQSPTKRRDGAREKELTSNVPCREQQTEILFSLFEQPEHLTFPNIFIFGHSATGKTYLLKSLIRDCNVPHVWINCIVVYSQRLLFEEILNQLSSLKLVDGNNTRPCDNACEFLHRLKYTLNHKNQDQTTTYLVFDKADKLCDIPLTVLSMLLHLQELTGLNLCVILVSENSWDKFHFGTYFPEPYILHFPEYSKDQLLEILLKDCPPEHSEDFYSGYLQLVLNVCFMVTRNLQELRYVALANFEKYCEPIRLEEATADEKHKLWKHVAPHLKNALQNLYLRESSVNSNCDSTTPNAQSGSVTVDRANVELPFFSKFLLLASYLASYNPPKADKQMFVKFSGKTRRKSVQQAKKRIIPQHERGPKVFPLHRMLAIFYSIIEEEPKPSTFLLSQISTLVSLRLLLPMGNDLDFPKYKCIVTLDFIKSIGKTVSFDVMGYLKDFL